MIGRFWLIHHRFFGEVIRFDGRLIVLNLFYLAWIVLLPFSSQMLGDYGGDEAAVILYAINLIGVILSGLLMFVDARRAGLSSDLARGCTRRHAQRFDRRFGLCHLDPGRGCSTRTWRRTAGLLSSSDRTRPLFRARSLLGERQEVAGLPRARHRSLSRRRFPELFVG